MSAHLSEAEFSELAARSPKMNLEHLVRHELIREQEAESILRRHARPTTTKPRYVRADTPKPTKQKQQAATVSGTRQVVQAPWVLRMVASAVAGIATAAIVLVGAVVLTCVAGLALWLVL